MTSPLPPDIRAALRAPESTGDRLRDRDAGPGTSGSLTASGEPPGDAVAGLPAEAITAVALRILERVSTGKPWQPGEAENFACSLLTDVAPHIRSAERARIRQLAIDLAQTTYHGPSDSHYHALGDFADLLAEGPS